MIGQYLLLNYFEAGALQMINLANQKKHCDFTTNDHMKKLHFCYKSKGCTTSRKTFCIHQNLYFHEMYKRIVGT